MSNPHDEPHSGSYRDVMTHKLMLEDVVRTSLFQAAINRVVSAGDRVIDFGSGTGVLAIFAARREAARVDAIERTPMARFARQIVLANGHGDIVVHEGDHESFETDGQADVLISEWMGHFLFFENMLPPLLALRDKWLKPEGRMLPERFTLFAALVTDDTTYRSDSFLERRPYGVNFSPIADMPRRQSQLVDFGPEQVLPTYCNIGDLDMRNLAAVPELLTGRMQVESETVVYGMIGWFHCILTQDIEFGTGPDDAPTHWRQLYFPFPEPLTVHPGRPLDITIRPPREGDQPEPGWCWSITDGVNERSVDERLTLARCRARSE